MDTFYKSAEQYYSEMINTLKDTDTSEHSIIRNALSPSSYVFSQISLILDEIPKMIFAKSALENDYIETLEQRCAEMGIYRKQATKATGIIKILGNKNAVFPEQSIVTTKSGKTYMTQEKIIIDENGVGYANIVASDYGSSYNCSEGDIYIMPVKYSGILTVENEEKIDNGYDIETAEALYNRYILKVQTPATSGNKYHYKNWALEITGVGNAEVYPLWNGNGTVKVVITNSNGRIANDSLIKAVYDHIEEERPIGPTITVISVIEKTINISANVQIKAGANLEDIKSAYSANLANYLRSNVKQISILKIISLLLDMEDVLDADYSSFKINNSSENIILKSDEIAVLGDISLTEV
ncbi:baseplate J/gp47 family protein [Clostridium beijerinckii]|uniref:baseplate J/gp47 family protein n=1 Tax=Clostridium beijerinckii TaxID=1520 RepID=UPI0009CAF9D8|nr:baseplate J/gp47 family protein [Clostridium beijerinckii]MBA8935518.1 putative phage protein gp47/JayE [Clostridium beijerinckii]NRU39913.1 putative phage protein gp47/JayE [Clostridium beijerinckii]NSA96808.1 putative phage protein gp47/JayE [Clostridium beijerinckii]OOM52291.1 baseplate J-like protein [Clostridium beijerinckii]OOM65493.1 baseplate J-like protein [Clostridium beijerinckii]